MNKLYKIFLCPVLPVFSLVIFARCNDMRTVSSLNKTDEIESPKLKEEKAAPPVAVVNRIDTADYNKRMLALSNGDTTGKWPVKTPYPLPGALLPYNRIIAFYGNLYSKRMGILGELTKR